ncbi:MAG: hypothetical protein ACJ78K_03845 [Gemmatimonadaceae bacterium]
MPRILVLCVTLAIAAHAQSALGQTGNTTDAAAAAAPSAPKGPPVVCVNDPDRHRFDFWIGEWNVTTKDGKPAGTSLIESVSGGCAILENWTSAGGGHGKSLNAYNPALHQWQQYWIGQDGIPIEFRWSQSDGKSLTFLTRDPADSLKTQRLTFTPLDAVTVRQHGESSADGGKSWKTAYDLYYHRKTK